MSKSFTFPRNPFKFPFHTWRGILAQPLFFAVFFLTPVLQGFQMDVIHQQVIFLGKTYPLGYQTLGWLPIVFFILVLVIAFSSTLFGRLFCGWVCPHNTLTEWLRPIRMLIGIGPRPFKLKQLEFRFPWVTPLRILASLLWAFVVTWALSTLFAFYFVPVNWYISNWQNGTLPIILTFGQGLLMLIGLFMLYAGHEFCRSACPYGLAQSLSAYLSAKWIPMEIRYRPSESQKDCGSCSACQSACPVDIDPRTPENLFVGVGEGCFNCGECIDACSYVREFKQKPGLLYFQLPQKGDRRLTHRELAE